MAKSPMMWPAWRFGPGGKSAVFQTEADVPEGWLSRDEMEAKGGFAVAEDAAVTAPPAPEDAEAQGRLKEALMGLPGDVLDQIEDAATLPDAAARAIAILVAMLPADPAPAGDLNGDGKVEDNRDEIKAALKARGIEFDGRAGTATLKALLDEAVAKDVTGA